MCIRCRRPCIVLRLRPFLTQLHVRIYVIWGIKWHVSFPGKALHILALFYHFFSSTE